MADDKKVFPTIELAAQEKQLIKNTESTVHSVLEDVKDIGDTIDHSKVTLEQLSSDFYKFRREHDAFKLELRRSFSDEVAKQVQPLVAQLEQLTTNNPRFVYIKFKFKVPFVTSILKFPYAILKKTWLLIRHS